jgi:hypothetical protein
MGKRWEAFSLSLCIRKRHCRQNVLGGYQLLRRTRRDRMQGTIQGVKAELISDTSRFQIKGNGWGTCPGFLYPPRGAIEFSALGGFPDPTARQVTDTLKARL